MECLRVGAAERGLLLALAVKLMGSEVEGEDLYHQKLLDCHDAIQLGSGNGFTGSNYKFYLYQSIKWGAVARRRALGLLSPLEAAEQYDRTLAPAPVDDELATLAAQVEQELEGLYPQRWVNAFRLHVAGKSSREIAALMTPPRHHSVIARKFLRMKTALREAFGQTWANLEAE